MMEEALTIGILVSLACSATGYGLLLMYQSLNFRRELKLAEIRLKHEFEHRRIRDVERSEKEGRAARDAEMTRDDCPYTELEIDELKRLSWIAAWQKRNAEISRENAEILRELADRWTCGGEEIYNNGTYRDVLYRGDHGAFIMLRWQGDDVVKINHSGVKINRV